MTFGFDNAMNEITLALFTTLAPAGAMACAIVCFLLLLPTIEDRCRNRLSQYLWIPILVALVGLVASATHLGNPSNALYVLTGVGRSPLSNEIVCAIVAFGLAGSYWLASFAAVQRALVNRIWRVAIICAALAFTASLAFAYDVETIVTWSLPTTPLNVGLNALMAGPLIALVVFVAAERSFAKDALPSTADRSANSFEGVVVPALEANEREGDRIVRQARPAHPILGAEITPLYNLRVGKALVILSGAALFGNIAGYIAQGFLAGGIANSTLSVTALVPHYGVCVAAFAVLAAVGVAIDAYAVFRVRRVSLRRCTSAAALALAGIFVMRFVFYMMHMTVGISL